MTLKVKYDPDIVTMNQRAKLWVHKHDKSNSLAFLSENKNDQVEYNSWPRFDQHSRILVSLRSNDQRISQILVDQDLTKFSYFDQPVS